MTRGRTARVMSRRLSAAEPLLEPVLLLAEEPLEVRLDGELVTATTRTPGHDFELAVGYCHLAGLLRGRTVHEVRYCATGSAMETEFNVVSIGTSARIGPPAGADRAEQVGTLSREVLATVALPAEAKPVAVAFDPASVESVIARSDVRSEHAFAKVIGRLLLDGRLPAVALVLLLDNAAVVGAAAIADALTAGFGSVVTRTPPSAAAVTAARRGGLLLWWLCDDDDVVVLAPDPLQPS